MGVVFTSSDCEFGIVNRLHALYKVSVFLLLMIIFIIYIYI